MNPPHSPSGKPLGGKPLTRALLTALEESAPDADASNLRRIVDSLIGKAIAGGVRGGLIVSIALGFIGAILGPWVAHKLKLHEPFMVQVSGHPFPVLWSIIGAALFVAIVHLFSRRR